MKRIKRMKRMKRIKRKKRIKRFFGAIVPFHPVLSVLSCFIRFLWAQLAFSRKVVEASHGRSWQVNGVRSLYSLK